MNNHRRIKIEDGYFMSPVSCTIHFQTFSFKQALEVFTKTKQIRELRQLYGKTSNLIFFLNYRILKVERTLEYKLENPSLSTGSVVNYDNGLTTELAWPSVSHPQQGGLDLCSLKALPPPMNSISKEAFLGVGRG